MSDSALAPFKAILKFLFLSFLIVSANGCGGGGGGGTSGAGTAPSQASVSTPGGSVVTPTQPTNATIRLESVLARTVPSEVTHLRLTGFDLSGAIRYGPESKAKAPIVDFTSVPVSVRRILVEYLAGNRVVGMATSDVILEPGQVQVMSNMTFSDVEAELTSISIEPAQLTLIEGNSQQLSVVGLYNDGSFKDLSNSVSWTHSGSSVQVDGSGMVKSVQVGSSDIQARLGSLTASSTVNVVAAELTTLRFEPAEAELPAGMTIPFVVRGIYSNGAQRDLTEQVDFIVENPLIGEMTETAGLVKGSKPGFTHVRAFIGEQSAEAALTVTEAVLTRLDVSPAMADLPLGSQQSLLAIGLFSDGSTMDLTSSVRWTSESPDHVSVDETGLALGLIQGEARILASFSQFSGSSDIEVTEAVPTELVLEPFHTSIPVGQSESIKAVALYSDGSSHEVTSETFFQSTAPGVAEVGNIQQPGLVMAHSLGTATIHANFGNLTAQAEIRVNEAVAQWLRIEPFGASFANGTTYTFLVRALFSDGTSRDVTEQSTLLLPHDGVASLTGVPGEVKARQVGNGELSAGYLGLTAQAALTVTPAELVRIEVTPQGIVLPKGAHQSFRAVGIFTDDTIQDLTDSVAWSGNNSEVLGLNLQGEGIAVEEGAAEVSASLGGQRGTTQVSVGPAVAESLSMEPSSLELPKGLCESLTATVHYTDGTSREVNQQATFSSSAPGTASVSNLSSPGLVKAELQGQAVITASYEGLEATSDITVLAAALQSVRLEPRVLELPVGIAQGVQLRGIYSDQTDREITGSFTLTVDDEDIAGIQSSYSVEGRRLGRTTVTGTFGGFSSESEVSVTAAVPLSLKVIPSETPIELGMTRIFQASALLSDGNLVDVSAGVGWSSENTDIITVIPSGQVEAVRVGSAALVATLGQLRAEIEIEVVAELDSPWTTTGGNFARTGENLTEDAGPPESLLWQHSFAPSPTNTVRPHPVVSANGVVYASHYVYNREYHLDALDAATGDVLWGHDFEHGISSVGEPTYSDGKIYIGQCDHSTNSFMWCFDAVTGVPIWNSPMSVQWPRFWAPLVVEGGVFSQSGYYGGIQGWNAGNGSQRFLVGLEQTDQWSPSYYRGKIYSKARNTLRAQEPVSGAILESYALPYDSSGGRYSFPALADGAAFVIDDNTLHRIKLSGESGPPSWSSTGYFFRGVAAVSDGVVYGVSGGSLLALDADDGSWLWNFPGDNKLYGYPIIAGNYIYVSSGQNTYAVNRTTRMMEWTVNQGGRLSVADGRLFIMGYDAVLSVYELKQ